jgi:hypothetical protein
MTTPQDQPLCTTCDRVGTMLCSGCKSIHYCSTACQKIDWPIHKIICQVYTQFLPSRPGAGHHSAIYFDPAKAQPQFIWLRFEAGHSHPSFEDLEEYGVSEERIKSGTLEELSRNPMLDRHIESHHIILSVPEAAKLCPCCNEGHVSNDSLIKIDQELADFFRGPILAVGTYFGGAPVRTTSHLDLGPVDFRHIVDSLRLLYCQCEDDTRAMLNGKDLRAVRLNCEGDIGFVDRPTHEAVFEPKSTLLAPTEISAPVADKIGMPLIVRKVSPAVVWRDPRRPCRLKNLQAAMLNPPYQPENVGSLIVVRKDGKPLHPIHIQALFLYTATKLKDPDHPKHACLTPDMLLSNRIDTVSKEDFLEWYPTLWQQFTAHIPFVPSPFDIENDSEDKEASMNVNHM